MTPWWGRALLALGCFGVSACGQSSRVDAIPNPDAIPDPGEPVVELPFAVSGQRLKAWWFTSAGVELFSTFHDDELGVDCAFSPSAESARQVCFPSELVDVAYLDAACTEPVALVDSIDGRPPGGAWVTGLERDPDDTCLEDQWSLRTGYRVGELVYRGGVDAVDPELPPGPEVFGQVGSDCEPTSLVYGLLPRSVFRLETMSEERFVSGGVETRRATGGFAVRRLAADDGAELTVGILGEGDAPCVLQMDGLCVPTPFATRYLGGPELYTDAACSDEAFLQEPSAGCTQPKLGVKSVDGTSRVYELERNPSPYQSFGVYDPETGLPVLNADGTPQVTCEPTKTVAAAVAGPEVTAQLLTAPAMQTAMGSFQLLQRRAPPADGAATSPIITLEPSGTLVDEQGGVCRFDSPATRDSLGDVICRSVGPEIGEIGTFKDPACQTELYRVYGLTREDGGVDTTLLRRVGADRTWLSFKPYTGMTYARTSTVSACEPFGEAMSLVEVDRVMQLPTFAFVEH
jgi:hypothetical protein